MLAVALKKGPEHAFFSATHALRRVQAHDSDYVSVYDQDHVQVYVHASDRPR